MDVQTREAPGEQQTESARYLELLLEAAQAAPFDLDLRTRAIRHSPRLNAIAGFERDARPTLEDLRARAHPDDREQLMSIVPRAIAGERHFQHDVRILRAGELRWMHTRGEVILDDAGRATRVLGVALDITDRKRRELSAAVLHGISEELAQTAAPDEIFRVADDRVTRHFPESRLTVIEVDEERAIARVLYDSRHRQLPEELREEPLSDYWGDESLAMLRAGGVVAVADLALDLRFAGRAHSYTSRDVRASVIAPFVSDGRIRFAISLQKSEPHEWRDHEIELVGELAQRIHSRLERARAEEALRRSEERLRRTLEVDTVGVLFFNMDGRMSDANAAFARMSGYSRDELLALDWKLLTPPDWIPETERAAKQLAETGETEPYVKQLVRKDGSRWWALCAPRVLDIDAGDCVEFVIDISEERQASDALRRSDARLRTLVENILDYAIYGTDPGGVITDWTEGAVRVTGYRPDEVVGRPISLLYLPDDVAAGLPERELEEAALLGRTERESWKVRRDGGRFWANEITTAINAPDGRIVGFTIIGRDLTVQKLLEEERARQLERERKAREEAEAFLGVLSHELRTPVTSIYGTASLIAREPTRGDLVELLSDVQGEAARLARMIDDLLILSRVDRGMVQLAPEPILIQRVAPELVAELRRQDAPATFRLDMPATLPPVIADASALRQVLHNLLTNAVKYAGSDGPISVTARQRSDSVDVFVVDEGPGLGPDPSAVFSLFYRAPHTAQRASGTGIGLYVARGLMNAMGGTIEARTRETGGALFRLTLPVARDD